MPFLTCLLGLDLTPYKTHVWLHAWDYAQGLNRRSPLYPLEFREQNGSERTWSRRENR